MPKNILLVEDDQFLSTLLKKRLQKEGFNVLHAEDVKSALELAQSEKPDLMLLDIILPDESGFDVMEKMAADPRYKKMPIIIISNLGQDADIEKGRKLGAVEYLVKAQVTIDEIIEKIKQYLPAF